MAVKDTQANEPKQANGEAVVSKPGADGVIHGRGHTPSSRLISCGPMLAEAAQRGSTSGVTSHDMELCSYRSDGSSQDWTLSETFSTAVQPSGFNFSGLQIKVPDAIEACRGVGE